MMAIQRRNDEMVSLLTPDFQGRYEPQFAWKSICALHMSIPGIRAFYPLSGFDSNGDATDLGGLDHHLTYNGNPTYNYTGLRPYLDFDGVGDYLSHVDHADFDILGTETFVASTQRGLTLGGWFNLDRITNNEHLIAKSTGVAAGSSYALIFRGDLVNDPIRFRISDGAAWDDVDLDFDATTGQWYFFAGRYDPSTETKVWAGSLTNGLQTNTNVVGIPASLNNSNANFTIGGNSGGGSLLDGRGSMCWISTMLLSDTIVDTIFQQTRPMFIRMS